MIRRISAVIATAALALAGQAAARPQTAIDLAIDNRDFAGARKMIDQLPLRGGPKGMLDAYYGRLFAAFGQGGIAEPFLVRAIGAVTDLGYRDELKLALARAHEVDGFVERAESEYRAIAADAGDATIRRRAMLSFARLRLGESPDEAVAILQLLTGTDVDTAERWEAQLLLSRAHAIAGRAEQSKAALAAAWLLATAARQPANAIAITAMDMALDRQSTGDTRSAVGLMAIGRSETSFAGLSQLPVCGENVQPDDFVTVAIQADEHQLPIYSAVRASRPGIAQLFTVPMAVATQRIAGPGIYVTVRCRSAVDPELRIAGAATRDLPSWLAEQGHFFLLRAFDPGAGDPITQMKARVEESERRFGVNAPGLAPALLDLAAMQAAQGRAGFPAALTEGKATADRAQAILVKAGAPADIVEQMKVEFTLAFARTNATAEVAGPAAMQIVDFLISRPDTTPMKAAAVVRDISSWDIRLAQRVGVIDRLLAYFDQRGVGARDPLRQANELRRAELLRDIGTQDGLHARLVANGIPADLCRAADRPPSVPPAAVTLTSEDYPKDLLREGIVGMTTMEMAIDASGRVGAQRVIVSQPPGYFDAVTAEKLKKVTMNPAMQGDWPAACSAMTQSVRWTIPYQPDGFNPLANFLSSLD